MADRTPRRARVLETRPLTPQMIRVVLGGEGLDGFGAGAFTDHYVKLRITPPGASEPRTRTYTVRDWDAERGRLTIDFVHHGDTGVAGPWAVAARPGDELLLLGPGGAYTPDPAADWHLMAGDAAVIPAIAASLTARAGRRRARVRAGRGRRARGGAACSRCWASCTWTRLHGRDALPAAVAALSFPAGHAPRLRPRRGQLGARDRAPPRHIDRGLPAQALSISGYWKRDRTEEGWREDKPEWNRLVELDVAVA